VDFPGRATGVGPGRTAVGMVTADEVQWRPHKQMAVWTLAGRMATDHIFSTKFNESWTAVGMTGEEEAGNVIAMVISNIYSRCGIQRRQAVSYYMGYYLPIIKKLKTQNSLGLRTCPLLISINHKPDKFRIVRYFNLK
jgi:hypothetical protein